MITKRISLVLIRHFVRMIQMRETTFRLVRTRRFSPDNLSWHPQKILKVELSDLGRCLLASVSLRGLFRLSTVDRCLDPSGQTIKVSKQLFGVSVTP